MTQLEKTYTSDISRKGINSLPATTGIYLFKHGNELLYIGKSVNLKARLLSHLENAKYDSKEAAIVHNSDRIECIVTDSEFNALILESKLIQKYKPKYNARWRDDKSPLYIKITIKDNYPKISSTRKEFDKKSKYYGPFPSVRSVYELLREVRRVFPFCTQHKISKRPCFHSKIGLCNPCPNYIEQIADFRLRISEKRRYRRNIRHIMKVLDGQTEPVLTDMYKQLKEYTEKEEYEEALSLRNRIRNLEYLLHRKLFSPDTVQSYNASGESIDSLRKILLHYFPDLPHLHRIECVDISNFAMKQGTASLVVFTEGLIDKKEYRRFKIKDLSLQSDFEMMTEVLRRRFKQDWERPTLLVVDGGKPQVRTALQVLHELDIQIPLIGIAKHPDRLVIGTQDLPMVKPSVHALGFNMIRALRDESHRFAKKYHVLLRNKAMSI